MPDRQLSIVADTADESVPASLWASEAESMQDAGVELRRIALILPPLSGVRRELLTCADSFLTRAALRRPLPAPADSGRRRAG